MKPVSVILFLFCSCISFSQSAKKLNQRLRTELLLAEREQDSVYQLFLKERKLLEENRALANEEVKAMYSGKEIFNEVGRWVALSLFSLDQLDIPSKDIFPDGFNQFAFSNAGDFIAAYTEALNEPVTFQYLSMEPSFLKGDKLKDKNAVLQEVLGNYHTAVRENDSSFLKQRSYILQVEELKQRLDTLTKNYRLWISELESKASSLTARIETARENYRLNGPAGFPPAYKEVFPNLHAAEKGSGSDKFDHFSDRDIVVVAEDPDSKVWMVPDEPASYPDGFLALNSYLEHNLVYPASAKRNGAEKKIYVRFQVLKTGKITKVEIVRGIAECPECNEEVIRVLKEMSRWIPGKVNGKAVNSYFNLPVSFN